MLLKDKVAIVTGGASGIGRAIALGYAKEGATVVVADINYDGAAAVVEMMKADIKGLAMQIDVTNSDQIKKMVDTVKNEFGHIDILVNSAAYTKSAPLSESSIEDWDKIFATNVRGTLMAIQAVAEVMEKQGSGNIINMTSLAAFRGRSGQHAYCAASGTINTMSMNIAHQLGRFGIHVNAIAPGLINTDFEELTTDTPVQREERISRIPLQRAGNPEDVVGTAVFLASDMSEYITGITVVVDGGMQTHLSGFRD